MPTPTAEGSQTAISDAELKKRASKAVNRVRTLRVNLNRVAGETERTGPSKMIESFLPGDLNIPRVPWVSGGDADVHTKDGRETFVSVETKDLAIAADGSGVQFDVLYRIEELASDYTFLEAREHVQVDAPSGYSVVRCGHGRHHVTFGSSFKGEDHSWHDVSSSIAHSYLDWLTIRFDGKGDDDKGNAQLKATFSIPVTLRAVVA